MGAGRAAGTQPPQGPTQHRTAPGAPCPHYPCSLWTPSSIRPMSPAVLQLTSTPWSPHSPPQPAAAAPLWAGPLGRPCALRSPRCPGTAPTGHSQAPRTGPRPSPPAGEKGQGPAGKKLSSDSPPATWRDRDHVTTCRTLPAIWPQVGHMAPQTHPAVGFPGNCQAPGWENDRNTRRAKNPACRWCQDKVQAYK